MAQRVPVGQTNSPMEPKKYPEAPTVLERAKVQAPRDDALARYNLAWLCKLLAPQGSKRASLPVPKRMLQSVVSPIRPLAVVMAIATSLCPARADRGAALPWTTYEAEAMTNTGTLLGPKEALIAAESSGRNGVQLGAAGQYVEFIARADANALVARYSLPDAADGTGLDSTISLYQNGTFIRKLPLTSKYCWLYGVYPFSKSPGAGLPRHFYDEVRVKDLSISSGDKIRLQKDPEDAAAYCILDLVDLEEIAPPLNPPSNALSIAAYGAGGAGRSDDTAALIKCIAAAQAQHKTVWMPPGIYRIAGVVDIPPNATIQGAGMWHTTLEGDAGRYSDASKRVRIVGTGSRIHLADFAITGRLNYRNDSEPNDGLGGAYGAESTISRVWVEHTKAGAWIVNSEGLVVEGCRFRNTIADGINLCVGMRSATVTNCAARGTGDDCFAIWPATFLAQDYAPGLNVITHCTGQFPFLANGAALYGGRSNRIEDCRFEDLTYGCGVLISTTFPVGNNEFNGTTVVRRCDLIRCGGFDHAWGWRAALQLCLDQHSLSGMDINNLNITHSLSDGLSVIASGSNAQGGLGTLSNATLDRVRISDFGMVARGRHGLWIDGNARGTLTVSHSEVVEFKNESTLFTLRFPELP